MPIYEYRCYACGHEHEVLQKMSDPPLLECPDCGEKALKKMLSAAGFRLKGGGWYETDFKGEKKKNLHESGSEKKKPDDKKKPDGKKKPDNKTATSPKGASTA